MFRGILHFCCILAGLLVITPPVWADEYQTANELLARVDSAESENLSPDIRAAYDALKESLNSAEDLYNEYQSELNENLAAMRETEQSLENRLLGGATMGATGIGGQMLASGLAEQSADDAAAMDMNAYLATFKCDYGMGLNINGGETDITLPGANILLPLRNEYIELATRLRQAKESLGLPLGIESVEILDPTDANLYDNAAVGVTDYALDTAAERAASTETDEKIKTGAITAGVGAAAGLVGNLIINRDAPKERSREITAEYEKDKREIDNEIAENEQALTQVIEDNSKLVEEYNALLRLHKEFVLTITEIDCIPEFQEYIDYINGLDYITDMMTDASELVIEYDLYEMRAAYTQCADAAALRRQIAECEAQEYHEWVDGECVDNTPQYDQGYHLDDDGKRVPDAVAGDEGTDGTDGTDTDDNDDNNGTDDGLDDDDEDVVITGDLSCDAITNQSECENSGSDCYWNNGTCMSMACPDENPRFSSARGKRVGDACTYGNVARGHIFKYAAGTMRGDVDVGGTCSCSADACADGYKLESGMCTNCADGYHKNENDECVPDSTGAAAGGVSAVANENGECVEFSLEDSRVKNASNCMVLCRQATADKDCEIVSATMPEPGKCICNPNVTASGIDNVDVKYFSVCGDDAGKTGGTEICEAELFETLRVQPTAAIGLAQEYARVKRNDVSVKCNPNVVQCKNNRDCIQCTSTRLNRYYEFVFRKTDATADANIVDGVLHGLCGIYGVGYTRAGKASEIQTFSGRAQEAMEWPSYCHTDDAMLCTQIYSSAERFGYQAKMSPIHNLTDNGTRCALWAPEADDISNDYSTLDPYHFKKTGGNWYLSAALQNQICQYVEKQIQPIPLESCRCNDSYTQIPESEHSSYKDDVLTCQVNGDDVYFVFDDLSESNKGRLKSAEEIINCEIMENGVYTGKYCIGLDQDTCTDLANAVLESCPECSRAEWDTETNSCRLPASARRTNIEKGVKLGAAIGVMVAGVVITVVTGGTGTGAVIVAVAETAGAAATTIAESKMQTVAQDFLTNVQHCREAACAEQTIKEELQRMSNLSSRFTDSEIYAIDREFTRLIELVPDDSEIFDEVESVLLANNQLSFWDADSWEPEQIWAAIGNALQLTSLFTSVTGLTNSARVAGTRAVTISNKADDVFSLTRAQAKRLDDLALEEQRLLARQAQNPGAREAAEIRSNLTRVRQERQTLLNQLGNPSEEALNAAKAEAYRLDDLQQAEAELARLQQDRANLYTTNRNGQQVLRNGRTRHDVTALDNQIAAQQQRIRELGGAVDDAVDDAADAVGAGARTGGESDDAARVADSATDDATDAARGADATNDATDAATDAASAGARGVGGAANAVRSATEQASDMLNNSGFRAALDEFEQTGKRTAVFPRDEVSDDAWDAINRTLESRGVRMRSGTSGGRAVMAFDNIPDHPATIARLRNRASSNFNQHLDKVKADGEGVLLPVGRLTDEEWEIVNNSLADDGIRLTRTRHSNGGEYMRFEEIPNHPATVARQSARNVNSSAVNSILTNSERATYRNTPAYVYQPTGLKESEAENIAEMINKEGNYYAEILNKKGSRGADYMVITMSKSDADKMRYVWNGNDLTYPIDNSQNMARLQQQIGKPITSIRGTPVVIETMSDFGRVSGRAIVMVRVGNKKIPFYISSGSAGKTNVPTGKWEFFGGITANGWFRKGTITEITNHYNSAELKQIADALDNTIGDLRDTELVLKTIGRQKLGGVGKVAALDNAPDISLGTINQSFPKAIVGGAFAQDLNAIKDYLRSL